MVVMIGLHSLLEYPLWYSYFLLPAAWAWGYALQPSAGRASDDTAPAAAPAVAPPSRALVAGAALLAAGAVFSVVDYLRVAAIFSASAGSKPLAVRVAEGQRSVFFAHHADYAAVTAGLPVPDPERAFARAVHFLLDSRLMMAWSISLAERGKLDEASHIAERLREFKKPDAEELFAVCETAASAPAAPMPAASTFACRPPARALGWRAFTGPD
jgi:hypothetical protein